MEKIAIIVPSFNERNNISILIKKLIKLIPGAIIFVVDDNSPDKTGDVVQELAYKNRRITLVKRNGKGGRGGAVLAGFKKAFKNSEIQNFIEMDADFSHSPDDISKLEKKIEENTIIVGSRYVRGSRIENWPMYRRVLSRLANLYIKIMLGVPINDSTNGFRIYPREAVNLLLNNKINHKGFITLSEVSYLLHRKGFKFVEVPITFRDREKGKSNATPFEILSSLFAIVDIKKSH